MEFVTRDELQENRKKTIEQLKKIVEKFIEE